MAGKNNANIGFEKQIWEAACELWGHIPAADYRKVIVGLIFLRYISFFPHREDFPERILRRHKALSAFLCSFSPAFLRTPPICPLLLR